MSANKFRFLSGNALKIIAAIAMLIDHLGYLFFPKNMALRAIGRLAFPIFAYFIAEGCRYTKNKVRHFLQISILALICQIVYYFFASDTTLFVLVSFSLAELAIFALQYFKKTCFEKDTKLWKKLLSALPFIAIVVGVAVLCNYATMDYGFWGFMLPVIVSLCDFKDVNVSENFQKQVDNPFTKFLLFTIGLLLLYYFLSPHLPKVYSLLTLPLIALYSGEKGKAKLKYFFYLFYPLHLVLLEGLYMLLYFL